MAGSLNPKRLLLVLAISACYSQQLPEAPGKAETIKMCSQCHELSRSVSVRQDKAGWQTTMTKMATLGMKGSATDLQTVFDYLASHYQADEVPKLNINTAEAIDIESALGVRRSQAAVIISYREKHGPFKSIDDLKKVLQTTSDRIATIEELIKKQDERKNSAAALQYKTALATMNVMYSGTEKLKALKPAETTDMVIGKAEITGYNYSGSGEKDKIEWQVIVKQDGKEVIKVASTSAFDGMAKRAVKATPASKKSGN